MAQCIWIKYDVLAHPSTFRGEKWGDMFGRAFQFGNGYEWRVPSSEERLYTRTEDGWVAIPVETFKTGLRPKPHRFLIALFKQEFKCAIAQFSPNAVHLILWFIAACEHRGLQPTFKDFFTIFSVKRSTIAPFYELVQSNRNSKLGSLVGPFKPVFSPDCMKYWQFEFVMMRGGEWAYMPDFNDDCKPTYRVPSRLLSTAILESLRDSVTTFGETWPKSYFFKVTNLKKYNCEYSPSYCSYASCVLRLLCLTRVSYRTVVGLRVLMLIMLSVGCFMCLCFVVVYPPFSMELPDLGFSDDKAFFGGIMAAYPPVLDHIKQSKGVAEIFDVGVEEEAGTEDMNAEVEEDVNLEDDPSDREILGHNEHLDDLEGGSVSDAGVGTSTGQKRRRLKRKANKPNIALGDLNDNVEDPMYTSFGASIDALFTDEYVGNDFVNFDEGKNGGQRIAEDLGLGMDDVVGVGYNGENAVGEEELREDVGLEQEVEVGDRVVVDSAKESKGNKGKRKASRKLHRATDPGAKRAKVGETSSVFCVNIGEGSRA